MERIEQLIGKEFKGVRDHFEAKFSRLAGIIDRVEQRLAAPGSRSSGGSDGPGLEGYVTPGQQFIEAADVLELIQKTRRGVLRLEKGFHPSFERKTLLDSTALGFSTPGILGADRIEPAILPLARRRLTVRDLLRARPVLQGQIDWIKESTFTNAASPQTEASAKAESSDAFTIASSKVHTIAHWLPVTRQALDDLLELRRFLDENLIYGLKLKEETELLSGDGLGDHLLGIATQATAYADTYAATGDTRLDKLRHAATELAVREENPSGFIINPVDYDLIRGIKTNVGGAGTGQYIASDPLGGQLRVPTLWGLPTVVTNTMPAGHFLAGDFMMAVIGDRLPATIDVSDSHSTYFTENKIAIRCEERIGLAVLRPAAFTYGSYGF
jgi:HK97 family phage major capsid protein